MITLGIALGVAMLGANPSVGLKYENGAFVMNDSQGERRVIVNPPVPPPTSTFAVKQRNTWLVWDNRGLTLRVGDKAASTRMPYIPTSPKVFSREQILENIRLIDQGKRQKEATALSGSEVIGDTVYLLVRWADADGKTWLEILMKVDTAAEEPKPEFVAKMPGMSLARGEVDDEMFVLNEKLVAVGTMGNEWGVSAFDVNEEAVLFKAFGTGLVRGSVQPDRRKVLFVERTSYGTQLAGEVELGTGARTDFAEARGNVSFFSAKPLLLRVDDAKGVALRYVDTGAEVRVPAGSEARMTGVGVLTWHPKANPQRALLYEPTRWIPVANWTAPPGGVAASTPPPVAAASPTATPKPVVTSGSSAASLAIAAAGNKPKAVTPAKPAPTPPPAPAAAPKKPAPTATAKPTTTAKKKPAKPKIEVTVKKKKG